MPEISTYDPKKVTIAVGGRILTGFAADGVVTITHNEDSVTPNVGAKGDVAYSENANNSGNAAINKLATFTIVTIVSSVSLVSAVISPAALATLKDLEKYAKLGHRHSVDDIDGLVELIEDLTSSSIPGGALFSADFTSLSNVKVADGYLNQSTKALEA